MEVPRALPVGLHFRRFGLKTPGMVPSRLNGNPGLSSEA